VTPVVVGHPTNPLTAGTPQHVKQLIVGTVFNRRLAGNKLVMDAELDVEKVAATGGGWRG
jgi:hypothetical protein